MATVRTTLDLITAALQTIGAYAASETLAAPDAEIGLETLQDLLAEWSDGGLMIPCLVTESLSMVVGQVSYTVGESGAPDLNTVRPEQVIGAYIRDSGGYDYPVEIIGESQYRALTTKSGTSGRPDRLYPKYSVPNATIYLYPEPDSTDTLYLVSNKTFIEPVLYTENLLNTTQLPRNYFNALKWNLAIELCTPFLREPTPLMVKRASDTKNTIKKLNMARTVEPVVIDIMGSTRYYNIFEG
jgi:hypothetical protein